jgi:AbiV family abortive infection protein
VEQYLKDAHLLVKNGSYGHVFALTVLGEEELSKAFIYHMCSEGLLPESVVERMGKNRNSHRRKQEIAATLAFTFEIVQFFQRIADSSKKEGEEDLKKSLEITSRKLKETMDHVEKNKDEIRSRMFQFLERFATLEEDKEKGLYVDVKIEDGVLTSPDSLEKNTVEKHLAQVKKRFQFAKPFLMTSIPPSETKRVRVLLEESGILKDFLKMI